MTFFWFYSANIQRKNLLKKLVKLGGIFYKFGRLNKKSYICIELVITLAIIDGVFIWQKFKTRYIRVYSKSKKSINNRIDEYIQ